MTIPNLEPSSENTSIGAASSSAITTFGRWIKDSVIETAKRHPYVTGILAAGATVTGIYLVHRH